MVDTVSVWISNYSNGHCRYQNITTVTVDICI